jgi:DNA polymerase III subunit epsilon
MVSKLDEVEFTVFDTETTGLEPASGDRVVEIAAIRVKGKEQVGSFHSLVNPGRPISAGAFAVNRITPEELAGAPDMQEVIPQFLAFIEGSCLCAYNAPFDLEFLENEIRLAGGAPFTHEAVADILLMAKRLLPGLERYALWYVADNLGIRIEQKHRALSDVRLTSEVFFRLKELLQLKGITDYGHFLSLCGLRSTLVEDIYAQKIAHIQEAITLGVAINIRYFANSTSGISQRQVIPKEIKREKNTAYLVGHCCLRNEERTFRIDGILHIEIV